MFKDLKKTFNIIDERMILPDRYLFKIQKDELKQILIRLQKSPQYLYERLECICVQDNNTNFEFYYFLSSDKYNTNCALTFTSEYTDSVISISDIYKNADYDEREIYDLFGVHFINHPNLKRILLPESFIGYPLRKNYRIIDERLRWNYE